MKLIINFKKCILQIISLINEVFIGRYFPFGGRNTKMGRQICFHEAFFEVDVSILKAEKVVVIVELKICEKIHFCKIDILIGKYFILGVEIRKRDDAPFRRRDWSL